MNPDCARMLRRIDNAQRIINSQRPLNPEEVKNLDNYFRIGLTYSSNALEGNSLTLAETKVAIEDGLTVGGKTIKDYSEAIGHAKAYDFMISFARKKELRLDENLVLSIHRLLYSGIDVQNAGTYRTRQVYISGTEYIPPEAEDVPRLMTQFIKSFNSRIQSRHPLESAVWAHLQLVSIHPFVDGNGRTARLLMNLILISQGYCVVSVSPAVRHDYISALISAQRDKRPDDTAFHRLIFQGEIEAQKDYSRLLRIPARCLTKNFIAAPPSGNYEGTIVRVSAENGNCLQTVGENDLLLHQLADLPSVPKAGQTVRISYGQEDGKACMTEL